jgi:hypothetical protein
MVPGMVTKLEGTESLRRGRRKTLPKFQIGGIDVAQPCKTTYVHSVPSIAWYGAWHGNKVDKLMKELIKKLLRLQLYI